MSLPKHSLDGNNLIISVQGEFVSDIPAGDGKIVYLFCSAGRVMIAFSLNFLNNA